ncbi:MAG: 2-hydroxyacid dehydrogenase [Lachnospiraceae bacterium]|nr:2-hydroxyacid dehydrogenase [Lachnospiraceae bacterium]
MKIAFYTTKPYDRIWFEPLAEKYGMDITFLEAHCTPDTLRLAQGYDAICIFINDYINEAMIRQLCAMEIRAILLRSAGFNHVDVKAAKNRLKLLRVPSYSPEAVAEYATALLLSVNRCIHRAYTRSRDFNMNINGLMGRDLHGKTAGIIGTGKIGQAMIDILRGFHMQILAYDRYPNPCLPVDYVPLEELFEKSHVISLHCPLTSETKHIINDAAIEKMKDGVYIINSSRGGLVDTNALLSGLLSRKIGGVGLDVYEEEEGIFYEDLSHTIVKDNTLARLMTFPNVIITSHMGFFTREAMQAIAIETLENAYALEHGLELKNEVRES